MSGNELISWLVGDAASVSDPEFLARCFVLLLVLTFSTAVMRQLFDVSRR